MEINNNHNNCCMRTSVFCFIGIMVFIHGMIWIEPETIRLTIGTISLNVNHLVAMVALFTGAALPVVCFLPGQYQAGWMFWGGFFLLALARFTADASSSLLSEVISAESLGYAILATHALLIAALAKWIGKMSLARSLFIGTLMASALKLTWATVMLLIFG